MPVSSASAFAKTKDDHDDGSGKASLSDAAVHDRAFRRAAALMKAAVLPAVRPYADSDNDGILASARTSGDADYVFAINDRRVAGDYVGQWGVIHEKGLPTSGSVTIERASGAVYDLERHCAVPFASEGGRTTVRVDLRPCDGAVLMATALASFLGCMAMALLANYPFALAPGLGLNAFFAYTICGTMGYSWQFALLAVFIEGLIFIVLSLTNIREAIFNAIPLQLKKGVSVGIGLFCSFIGLQNAKLVVDGSTLVTVVNFREHFSTVGIGALLAVLGLLLIAVLYVKNVRGAMLIGILATWGLGILCQLLGIYEVTPEAGFMR